MPDYLNLWTVKEGHNSPKCRLGDPILCGSTVRLEHTLTRKNLQSDGNYRSILSQRQDVSTNGYNGEGSTNDDWVIECNNGDAVYTNMGIHLKHRNTGAYLSAESKDFVFNEENCSGNCRIKGDKEVHAMSFKKNAGFQIKGV
jgi:dolichyl-phosphate-mannose--protein O-mannosyl transferase